MQKPLNNKIHLTDLIFVALLTLFIIDASSTSHSIKLFK